MTDAPEVIVAALAIVSVAVCAAIAAAERARRSRHREEQLSRAIEMLKMHYANLEKLDDDDTPSSVLDLALTFSKIIHDPRTPYAITELLKEDSNFFESEQKESVSSKVFLALERRRPDLAKAFALSAMSGTLAFIQRRPDCEKAFEPMLLRIGSAPGEETERVVRAANAARSRNRDVKGMPAPIPA